MTTEMIEETAQTAPRLSAFWATDPTLPRTASHAAIACDKMIRGVPVELAPITEMLALLTSSNSRLAANAAGSKAFVDRAGLKIVASAYNKAYEASGQPVKTRDDLLSAVDRLMVALKEAQKGDTNIEALKHLRDFCNAISEYASTYRKMIYGGRPLHPYRK